MNTELSEQQLNFLNQLAVIGSESIVCNRLGLNQLEILDWEENPFFKIKKRQSLRSSLSTLENSIARQSLSVLSDVLKHGTRTVTNTRTHREVIDQEGNLQTLNTRTVKQQTNSRPSWAVKAGIQIHLIKRLEENINNSISVLIDEGIIGEEIRDRILSVLENTDVQVQDIFSGNVNSVAITETMLAEIQQTLLGQ